jgi:peptidoglycan/xylan/chitin deacetylase (PgdA/CDA1 family)
MRTKFLIIILAISMLVSYIGCNGVTQDISQKPQSQQPQQSQETPFVSKIETPLYDGGPAIIFRLDDVAKGWNEEVVEKIIRLMGKNNVPLDVGIIPRNDGRDSYEMPFLIPYLDSGIIDISIHGDQHSDMEFDTAKSGTSYQKLNSDLITARSQIKQYFGVNPIAFTVPYDYYTEDGYKAVQDAGFKVFSTQKAVEPHPSIRPVDFDGNQDENGMSRLCTVNDVARWDASKQQWGDIFSTEPNNELFNAIDWGISNLGVAVVGIHPQAFLDASNNIDTKKLDKLDAIIKMCQKRGTVTTFESWYKYAVATIIKPPHQRINKTPAYNGGPAVIFRMDDAQKGVNEEAVERIIKIFEQNAVSVDVGVEPYGAGSDTYVIPFLLKYLDAGVIDISMHGYKNTFQEFDTKLSGATITELDKDLQKCFEDAYGMSTYNPTRTTYEELKAGLLKAREQFRNYFGFAPAAFTVPYDNFNEDGYRAVQDAGFKVFSSIWALDPCPSATDLVNYFCHRDINGMYRLPSIDDVSEWDSSKCQWGDVLTLTSSTGQLYTSINTGLASVIRLAILRIHPQAFVDARNKVDIVKLNKLDAIIKYIINNKATYGQITTFQSWYDYTSVQKPQ